MKYPALMNAKINSLFDYGDRNIYSVAMSDKYIAASLGKSEKRNKAYKGFLDSMQELPDSKAYVGIEVEVENIADDFLHYGWTAIKDGSLRNNGLEFVSGVFAPKIINKNIAVLYSGLASREPNLPDFSWRTSIHVHLCVRERTVEELVKLFLLYLIFERTLFLYTDKEREESVFCVPFIKSSLAEDLAKFCTQKSSIDGLVKHWHKYSAMNLIRLEDYGTVEFRHLPGTWEAKKVSNWIGILLSMYNSAISMPMDKIVDEIKTLNTTSEYMLFRDKVFGDRFGKLLAIPNFDLVSEGISFCKECLSGINSYKIADSSTMMKFIRRENTKKKDASNLSLGEKLQNQLAKKQPRLEIGQGVRLDAPLDDLRAFIAANPPVMPREWRAQPIKKRIPRVGEPVIMDDLLEEIPDRENPLVKKKYSRWDADFVQPPHPQDHQEQMENEEIERLEAEEMQDAREAEEVQRDFDDIGHEEEL